MAFLARDFLLCVLLTVTVVVFVLFTHSAAICFAQSSTLSALHLLHFIGVTCVVLLTLRFFLQAVHSVSISLIPLRMFRHCLHRSPEFASFCSWPSSVLPRYSCHTSGLLSRKCFHDRACRDTLILCCIIQEGPVCRCCPSSLVACVALVVACPSLQLPLFFFCVSLHLFEFARKLGRQTPMVGARLARTAGTRGTHDGLQRSLRQRHLP